MDTNPTKIEPSQANPDHLETLLTFIRKNMPTKLEMEEMEKRMAGKEDINKILTAVDAYAKQSKDYYQEVLWLWPR